MKDDPHVTRHRRPGWRTGAAVVALLMASTACGASRQVTHLAIAMDGTTTVTGPGGLGIPTAFFWDAVGCVKGPGSLVLRDVTLHRPAWGLVVSDWGVRYRPRPRRFSDVPGAFSVRRHSLRSYGFSHRPFTTHCPQHADQLIIVLTRTGRGRGGTAGVDLHFTNGTSAWLRLGMGLCDAFCGDRFDQRVIDGLG